MIFFYLSIYQYIIIIRLLVRINQIESMYDKFDIISLWCTYFHYQCSAFFLILISFNLNMKYFRCFLLPIIDLCLNCTAKFNFFFTFFKSQKSLINQLSIQKSGISFVGSCFVVTSSELNKQTKKKHFTLETKVSPFFLFPHTHTDNFNNFVCRFFSV